MMDIMAHWLGLLFAPLWAFLAALSVLVAGQ
jgi:hypothetical protein